MVTKARTHPFSDIRVDVAVPQSSYSVNLKTAALTAGAWETVRRRLGNGRRTTGSGALAERFQRRVNSEV